jgi:hypothetical protein
MEPITIEFVGPPLPVELIALIVEQTGAETNLWTII